MSDRFPGWTRAQLMQRGDKFRDENKAAQYRCAQLQRDLEAALARAEIAEREIRELDRKLRRERQRAEEAEARFRSFGLNGSNERANRTVIDQQSRGGSP
jgi:hypothetical protein